MPNGFSEVPVMEKIHILNVDHRVAQLPANVFCRFCVYPRKDRHAIKCVLYEF